MLWKGGRSGPRREDVAGVSPSLNPSRPGEQMLNPDLESWFCLLFAVWFLAGQFTSMSQFPYL